MGTKSRERLYGSTISASAAQARDARRKADVLACEPGARDQLLRIRARAGSGDEAQRYRLVRAIGRSQVVRLRRPVAAVDWLRGTKAKPIEGAYLLYSFLTTEPNAVVAPIHPKAMPVILHRDDWQTWLTADDGIALKLQKPWPDDQLEIVKRGTDKADEIELAL